MKTYEVSIKVCGLKRIKETYVIHASNKESAERTALTQYAEEHPERMNLGIRYLSIAKLAK